MVDAGGRGVEDRLDRLDIKVDALDTKVEHLDTRVGRLETKVDALDDKVDRMHGEIGEAFVEQRRLVFETADSLRHDLIQALASGLAGVRGQLTVVQGELESMRLTTTGRFDTLERKLDAFTGAQAVVNQRLLERLDAQEVVNQKILTQLGG